MASDVERAPINAMQREENKSPGEGAESVIIIFRLAFTSSHRPCRAISNPLQARNSSVKFKVGHEVNSSKGEYSCSFHLHSINRPNLQCMKQQSTVQRKLGRWTLGFHERTSGKPKCGVDRRTPSDAGSGPNSGSRPRRDKKPATATAYGTR